MRTQFSQEQLCTIAEQAMLAQCACPSMLGKIVHDLQRLHEYQLACLERDDVEAAVHQVISEMIEAAYPALELCLMKVLLLENWDLSTLEMPEKLRNRQLREAAVYEFGAL